MDSRNSEGKHFMKDVIEGIRMFLLYPEKTIKKKSEEFRETRKKRYQRKEYIRDKRNRKFLPFGFVSQKEIEKLKAELNALRDELETLTKND